MRCAICKTPTCEKCAAPFMREQRYIGMVCKACAWKRATTTEDLNEMRKYMLLYLVPIANLFYYVVVISYLRYILKNREAWLDHYMEGMREARLERRPKPIHAYPAAFVAPIVIIIPLVLLIQGTGNMAGLILSFGYLIPAFGGIMGYIATLVAAKTMPEEKILCQHKEEAKRKFERQRDKKKAKKKRR
jgi:hypothetical protein